MMWQIPALLCEASFLQIEPMPSQLWGDVLTTRLSSHVFHVPVHLRCGLFKLLPTLGSWILKLEAYVLCSDVYQKIIHEGYRCYPSVLVVHNTVCTGNLRSPGTSLNMSTSYFILHRFIKLSDSPLATTLLDPVEEVCHGIVRAYPMSHFSAALGLQCGGAKPACNLTKSTSRSEDNAQKWH